MDYKIAMTITCIAILLMGMFVSELTVFAMGFFFGVLMAHIWRVHK